MNDVDALTMVIRTGSTDPEDLDRLLRAGLVAVHSLRMSGMHKYVLTNEGRLVVFESINQGEIQ
jgi:hypothetical protein